MKFCKVNLLGREPWERGTRIINLAHVVSMLPRGGGRYFLKLIDGTSLTGELQRLSARDPLRAILVEAAQKPEGGGAATQGPARDDEARSPYAPPLPAGTRPRKDAPRRAVT